MLFVFLVLSLLVNTEKHLAGIQTVNVIFLQFISFDRTILMNHRIGISHSIIKNFYHRMHHIHPA